MIYRVSSFRLASASSGSERAAIAHTILGSCRLAQVNPVEYLADVLPRLARRIRLREMYALVPARWKPGKAAAETVPEPAAAAQK